MENTDNSVDIIRHFESMYKIKLTKIERERFRTFLINSDLDKKNPIIRPVSQLNDFKNKLTLLEVKERKEVTYIDELIFALHPVTPGYISDRRTEARVSENDLYNIVVIRSTDFIKDDVKNYIYIYNPALEVVGGIIFEDI